MRTTARVWVAAAALAAAAGPGLAFGPKPGAAVPATQEIELLDPGVDPLGNPRPVLTPGPGGGPQQVVVPPTILFHRFYYTGDRTFQGPMLPGGPVVVTCNHPKTLERVYVPVTLPPGAPRVTYTGHTIRYDYGPQSVTLAFGACGKPAVKYSQATCVGEAARNAAAAVATGTTNFVQRTGIPQGVQRFGQGAKNVMGATADRIQDAGRIVATPVVNGLRSLPGAQMLSTSAADRAARGQQQLQRQADRLPADPTTTFVPRNDASVAR